MEKSETQVSREVEPGVPEVSVGPFQEAPSEVYNHPPYTETQEALFARADAALRDYQVSREKRAQDTEGDLYAIGSALSLTHSLIHNLLMRSPVGGVAWETLSAAQERVGAAREGVVGLGKGGK